MSRKFAQITMSALKRRGFSRVACEAKKQRALAPEVPRQSFVEHFAFMQRIYGTRH